MKTKKSYEELCRESDERAARLEARFAASLRSGVRNPHLPTMRDTAMASQYAWMFLDDARQHDMPAIGSLDTLEEIRERRRHMTNGYGLIHRNVRG